MYSDVCCAPHAPSSSAGPRRQPVYIHYPPVFAHKQYIPDEIVWAGVMTRARMTWPDSLLDDLVERTVTDIKRTIGSRRAAFVWSGAKDSLVLAHLAGLAGIHECVLTITDLEYPEFLRWVTDRMPDGVTVLSTGHDLRWLREHPQMLFPQGVYGRRWHTFIQQREHERYYQQQNLGMLLLGPRRAGDYAYGPAKQLTWKDRSGVVRYTPLVDWSPEAMLALLQREQIPLPPCYGWPRGLQVGPGPWPARQGTTSTCHGFEEVWEIDPDIIRSAAPNLPRAERWLDLTGRS